MGTALLRIKLMPSSLEVDLEKIKEEAKDIVENGEGKSCSFAEEPVAFGLKAIVVSFDIDESQEIDPIEEGLSKIEGVNSAQIIDMRRAFG